MQQQLFDIMKERIQRVPASERHRALQQLREAFLAGAPPEDYLSDRATCAAYEEFFFPQSFHKARLVLAECQLPSDSPSVLDLGSAMGPMGFAALQRWPNAQITLVDRSQGALAAARDLAKAMHVNISTQAASFAEFPSSGRFDLIILGNALLELPDDKAEQVVRRLLDQHASAQLLIVEPADRLHSRRLQALRDRLLATVAPIAPCAHQERCPAQQRERDFCHEARAYEPGPDFFVAASQRVGLSDIRLRFSYLLYDVRHKRAPDGQATSSKQLVRIISHPLKEKGRLRYFGCAASGLVEVMRQDRLRSESNAAFDALGRGALIDFGVAPNTRIKVADDTIVNVIRAPDDAEG